MAFHRGREDGAGAVISRLIGLLFYLIFLGLANLIAGAANVSGLSAWVGFFNSTLGLVVLFSIIFLFGDLFETFHFPFSLPFPVFDAYASMLVVSFIFRIISFAAGHNMEFYNQQSGLIIAISAIVAVIVLLSGFGRMLANETHGRTRWKAERMREEMDEAGERIREKFKGSKEKRKHYSEEHDWHDVGNEFREFMYDLFSTMRESLRGGKKKGNTKQK